jgi:TolA-binding protein
MIKTLNYIVGLAVLLVAFGIPLRIYLLNAEEQDRERMLEDLMPQANVPTTSHGNKSKLLDLSNVPDSTMIDLLKQLESDLPAYLSSPQGVLQDGISDDPEAMDRYLKTLEQDPANHKAIYDLAIRYIESGDVDQAWKLANHLKQYDRSMAGNLRELIKKVRRDE